MRFYSNNNVSIASINVLKLIFILIIPGTILGFIMFPEAGLFAPIMGIFIPVIGFIVFIFIINLITPKRHGKFTDYDGSPVEVKINQLEYRGKTINFDSIQYANETYLYSRCYTISYVDDKGRYVKERISFGFERKNEFEMFKSDFLSKYRMHISPRENICVG
ncbi:MULTISPECIES: hypothetical protein [unclassified Paenibacillus]|uniref:hypothetical protein n=1 Tax=unclassified Paenibacillus TaxID=185978 RepID=UPI0027884B9F|nr:MULTISPECIES: hypothetical protein [unclassified Paenibacillus]MDQ0896220.1 hypothetical protein [Paenibacillus sp. V4I7]MDQ0913964.1 hypothetical protein [Paenibacillus sp. V4I5]